jgi:TonB-linked SusC/RagA family outer membrane protein
VKLTGILLVAAFLQVSAGSVAQRLSISVRNGSLEKIFAEIEKKTNYVFFYDASLLQKTKPVTVEMKDASVEEVLHISLKGQGLDFSIQDRTIFLKREAEKPAPPGSPTAPAAAANGPIQVVVQSEAGAPIVGATVVIAKLNKQGMTDNKGEFVVKGVPDGEYEVIITNIGFEKHVGLLKVADGVSRLAVRMKQAVGGLDEMVVKGYYMTSARLNTGNVTKVKSDVIEKQPVSDPIQALIGRVPGMNIQQTSGVPGAYAKIQIRGQNSIANGNDPLYIVDGVPFSSVSLSSPSVSIGSLGAVNSTFNNGNGLSPFNGLNPADIESIEVLKDADATAIYGSRGANGVVLITTKRGNPGDTRFDINVFSGEGAVAHELKMLNTPQYLAMRREAYQNDGLPFPSLATNPKDINYDINGVWDTTRYTNWQKVIMGNPAHFTSAQANVSGGNAYTQFIIGGGYSRQGAVFLGDYADQKASAHLNLTHTSMDHRFNAQFIANYVNDINDLPAINMIALITAAPDAPNLYISKGNINWQLYNGTATFPNNPAAILLRTTSSVTNNLISNLNLRYELLPGLELKGGFGYNRDQMNQTVVTPATSFAPPNNNVTTSRDLKFATTDFTSWIIEPQVSYVKGIGGGKLEVLAGSTFQENKTDAITQDANGFVSDALIQNPKNATNLTIVGTNDILYRYTAVYGRVSYNWKDKYIINLTGRRDGSSRFGPGKQFGDFGAVGAAWIFSKEKFILNHLPVLSFGKLRGSYGSTGNDQIPDYQFLSTYNSNPTSYQGINGLTPARLTNPNFAWEVVNKLEVGLELGLLKDRIYLSASYYRNRTGNQLVGLSLPYLTGFNIVQFNLPAVVQNSGFEFILTSTNVRSKAFEWSTSINGTLPYNKLVSFPNLANFGSYKYSYVVGKSLFIKPVYHSAGVNPQSGLYSFATKNANGVPTVPQDLIVTKPVTQAFFGGIGNRFSYKGFSLDIFIQYVSQYSNAWINALTTPPGYSNFNQLTNVIGRWKAPGDLTAIERAGTSAGPVAGSFNNEKISDASLADASFFRLKNVSLSYQLPPSWKSKIHLQNARFYIQGQNLFMITNYVGLDPETAGQLVLPPVRMITAGFQAGF